MYGNVSPGESSISAMRAQGMKRFSWLAPCGSAAIDTAFLRRPYLEIEPSA
ncbi:Uncharacterised protein [Bordetella pertussis]|nr:Uncharacterised protein [Bordetella pertussis]